MSSTRGKKLAFNTLTSMLLQITNIISGFILPRLILDAFGSEVNGLVNSITQFLGVVTLLDLGVGAVVQSSLYKPLAENDKDTISKIYVSASKFFKRLAIILLAYVCVLLIVYPLIVNQKFDYWYTAALIGAICISSFAQYYFGIVNSLLLTAHQKGYIQYTAQIITIILNTIACAILINLGGSIQMVKLTTSLIYLIRPFFLVWYVRKRYDINRKIIYDEEPIKQKWNGMAQHFASYVLTGTDNIVLTFFSTLENVSIYSVYYLVVNGVFMLITSLSNGFSSYFGDIWAKNEQEKLETEFKFFEWVMHILSVLIFGCAGTLIINFIKVYTKGINDAEYVQPLFAFVLTIAFAARVLRIPYNYLILAAGHYKQTQSCYTIAMILNIVLSVISVQAFGLVGVAVGTFIAMAYQTIWMALYDYQNFVILQSRRFIKLLSVDCLITVLGYLCTFKIPMAEISYMSWMIQAVLVFIIWTTVVFLVNRICYKKEMLQLVHYIRRKIKR